jgi:hypothetical protein
MNIYPDIPTNMELSEFLEDPKIIRLFTQRGFQPANEWMSEFYFKTISYIDSYEDVILVINRYCDCVIIYNDNKIRNLFSDFTITASTLNLIRAYVVKYASYRLEGYFMDKMAEILPLTDVIQRKGELTEEVIHNFCGAFMDYINYDYEDSPAFRAYTNCMLDFRDYMNEQKVPTLAELCARNIPAAIQDSDSEGLRCVKCNYYAAKYDINGVCFYGCFNGCRIFDYIKCSECLMDTPNYEDNCNTCSTCTICLRIKNAE